MNQTTAATEVANSAQASQGGLWQTLIFLLLFIFIIYFLMWRPQSRKAKEHRLMIENLKEGDEVITGGGIYGKIKKIEDSHIVLLIATNIEVIVQKQVINLCLPKGTIKEF